MPDLARRSADAQPMCETMDCPRYATGLIVGNGWVGYHCAEDIERVRARVEELRGILGYPPTVEFRPLPSPSPTTPAPPRRT